jgi:uncharacterized protein (DUF58 family)
VVHGKLALTPRSEADSVRVALSRLIALRRDAAAIDLAPGRAAARHSGAYHSSFRGRGIDFDEVRIYQPGDDVRSIDWRVTARTGRPHTRLYREERERPLLLWVDQGRSMQFATRGAFKSVIAAEIAALIAWAAVANGDRVGGLLFGGGEHFELRPRSRRDGVLPLLRRLAGGFPAAGGDESELALQRLRRVVHPGSLVVLVSDFASGLQGRTAAHLSELSRHNELVMIEIHDPVELEAPPPGRYPVCSGEEGARFTIHSDRHFAEQWRRQAEERVGRRRALCRRLAIHDLSLATSDDPLPLLADLFGHRRGGGR